MTKLEGIVAGTRWVNPHVLFWIKVGEGADEQQWLIEAPDHDSLVHDGWRQPSAGERILLYVYPHAIAERR